MNRLGPDHRRFLLVDQAVGGFVVNVVLSGTLGWLFLPRGAAVPLWGQFSIAGDTLATAFLLPFMTSLIANRIIRAQVRRGRVRALPSTEMPTSRWAKLPSVRQGFVLGVGAVVLTAVPVILVFVATGLDAIPFWNFIAFKAGFAGVLGVLVTPPIAWWSIVRASRHLDAAPLVPSLSPL